MKSKTCEADECSVNFSYQKSNRKFCSNTCAARMRYRRVLKRKPVDGRWVVCGSPLCNKLVWIYPREIKAGKKKFCGSGCFGDSLLTAKTLQCVVCSKDFVCTKSQALNNRKTCSNACRGVWTTIKADNRRKTNPPTKGVLNRQIRYSKRMEEWRLAVFKRDDYTCQMCGVRGVYLEADHIKPFAYFEDLRFDLNNGRTLCKPCHRDTETYGRRALKLYAKA